nr:MULTISPECIES: PEP/pyruvate-binding domain-containing protein [Halorhodospira]
MKGLAQDALKTSTVILGAGEPHKGKTPSPLTRTQFGTTVLEWTLNSINTGLDQLTFVAGYSASTIRAQNAALSVVENPDWAETGSGASLLVAPLHASQPTLVSYGDILFRAWLVEQLRATHAPIAIAWDSAWRTRYSGRSEEDLVRCEKVAVANGHAVRLGSDIPVDWADGEFIGLVYFAPEAVDRLRRLQEHMPESLRTVHLSGLIEYLRAEGLTVEAVDARGDWAEVNEPRDIAHFVLGTKAETLSRLRGMVRSATILDQVAFTVADWQQNPAECLQRVRHQLGGQSLVVRSSARSEDAFTASNAGAYHSVLGVDPDADLQASIEQVLGSYAGIQDDDQVLVQPMLDDVAISGVAFTRTLERGAPWYVINYERDGNTEGITSGSSTNHATLLHRRGAEVSELPDPRLQGVLTALQEIEGLLGFDTLDVEFAIDCSDRVHILQVRPIAVDRTEAGVGDEACNQALAEAHHAWRRLAPTPPQLPGEAPPLYGVMPDWNPAEIIGTAPGQLAESLYRELVMDEVWAQQRAEYGYRDVRPAPLLVSFAGRPFVDVRASFASFIPASVSEPVAGKLLRFYVDWLRARPQLHDKVEFEVVPTCLAPGFKGWKERLRREAGLQKEEIAELRAGLHGITAQAFTRSEQDLAGIERLAERFERIQHAELDPLERARLLLDDCRRLGTLPFAHLARSGFVAVTLLRGAEATGAISPAARESFLSTLRTVSHQLTADARATADGTLAWEAFVERYGHLRPGTYDIHSPRYDADPERFLRPLVEHAKEAELEEADATAWERERAAFLAALAELELPAEAEVVETFLRQAIEGREYAKFVFSRNLSAALEALAAFGDQHGLSRSELADLPLPGLLATRDARCPGADTAQALRTQAATNREARKIAEACELPPLMGDAKQLDAFLLGADRPNFVGSSAVTAEAIDLARHSADEPPPIAGRIALIPQADPGYDWLFGQGIAGLITLFGGANSHMAIRAAEFGLPAAIGVGEQRYREIAQARVLELDPPRQILRVIR